MKGYALTTSVDTVDEHPYAGLSPDCVLDALDSVGVRGDGRLIALNSYENRVYQAWRDDAPPMVAKFYRPGRWSDAAIRISRPEEGARRRYVCPDIARTLAAALDVQSVPCAS